MTEKAKEKRPTELSILYGMGAEHKEKILEGIRELEKEHNEEREN